MAPAIFWSASSRSCRGSRSQRRPARMYAFFKVDGSPTALALRKRLVPRSEVWVRAGSAFGPEGESLVRWRFAADQSRLAEAWRGSPTSCKG